ASPHGASLTRGLPAPSVIDTTSGSNAIGATLRVVISTLVQPTGVVSESQFWLLPAARQPWSDTDEPHVSVSIGNACAMSSSGSWLSPAVHANGCTALGVTHRLSGPLQTKPGGQFCSSPHTYADVAMSGVQPATTAANAIARIT